MADKKKYPIELFSKCPICGCVSEYGVQLCGICGAVFVYDEEEGECYVSERLCSKCGFVNNVENSACEKCFSKFTMLCPKCRHEVFDGDAKCSFCGTPTSKFYIEDAMESRLNTRDKRKHSIVGLIFLSAVSFMSTLALIVMSLNAAHTGEAVRGYIFGATVFFIVLLASLLDLNLQRKIR